jgi:hypothetical protein
MTLSRSVRITLLLGPVLVACGGAKASGTSPKDAVTQRLPLDRLYLLEAAGVPPNDTVATFKVGEARTVVLRHAPPDDGVFAELVFPANMFKASSPSDSVTVVAAVRPGMYGLDIAMTLLPENPGVIRFKYPVHFRAPVDAIRKYGSAIAYEHALQIGREEQDGRYALYLSTRRASDNLESILVGPGRYAVGAPR